MSSQPHRTLLLPGDGSGPVLTEAAGRGGAPTGVKIDAFIATPIEF